MSNRLNKNTPSTFVKTASAGHPAEENDGMGEVDFEQTKVCRK